MYRMNCPPPPEPKEVVPFLTAHPLIYKAGIFIVGASISVVGLSTLIFGVYRLGRIVFNYIGPHNNEPGLEVLQWIMGIITIGIIITFCKLSMFIGKVIIEPK